MDTITRKMEKKRMNYLVVFDSNFGNTQKIAEAVGKGLGPETLVVMVDDYREQYLEGVRVLVIGSPINGWKPTPKISVLMDSLQNERFRDMRVAVFDTRVKAWYSGDAAKKMAKELATKGAEIIVPPEFFYVKGQKGPLLENEVERAVQWGENIRQKITRIA